MRQITAALATGLLLIAGQAAGSPKLRIGDRVGAESSDSTEFAGVPLAALLVATAVMVAVAVIATDNGREND